MSGIRESIREVGAAGISFQVTERYSKDERRQMPTNFLLPPYCTARGQVPPRLPALLFPFLVGRCHIRGRSGRPPSSYLQEQFSDARFSRLLYRTRSRLSCCDRSCTGAIIKELRAMSADKGIKRFISTHPDDDHFGGIHLLDAAMPICNFYVVNNSAIKDEATESFERYCQLRDGDNAFHIRKDCKRKWLNQGDDERGGAGISILWPDRSNESFQAALDEAEHGLSPNNISTVIRYVTNGVSFL